MRERYTKPLKKLLGAIKPMNNESFDERQPRPWVRFFARILDLTLYIIIISIVWILVDETGFFEFSDALFNFCIVFSWIFVEGLLLTNWGTTPAKSLLKIYLRNKEGARLTAFESFKRSRLVWFRGMGIGIAIIQLIANIVAYRRLKKMGVTTWDEEIAIEVTYKKIGIVRLLLLIFFLCIIMSLAIYGLIE
jgi:hypothetical protein